MTRLRRLAKAARGAGFPHAFQGLSEGAFPLFKVSDFSLPRNERELRSCTNWVSKNVASTLGAIPVPSGSVLLPKIGAALLGNARRITTQPSLFDNNVMAVVPRTAESRYIHYWLSTVDMRQLANPGPVPSLSESAVLDLNVPIVERSQQRAIADFLDRETARIDALIAKKRAFLCLAEERFERVVFDGIRGRLTLTHAELQPSGLDWLGNIPVHWGLPPVGAYYDVVLGKMLNPAASSAQDRSPYLRNTNVKWDGFDLSDLGEMHFDPVEQQKYELRDGDLLVCEGGEVGRAAVWFSVGRKVFFQKAIHRVRPRGNAKARFLMYCLRAAAKRNVFVVEGNQATIVHLTAEKLRVHRFPYPPPTEQAEIAQLLDKRRDRLEALRQKLNRQLDLLREHRQALITAAVTGQMDISAAA